MTGAGFGLKLHDLRHGTRHIETFNEWWAWARGAYLNLEGEADPTEYTFYYDPLLDMHHRLPLRVNGLYTAWWLAAMEPADAQRFFDLVAVDSGLRNPELNLPHPKIASYALFLAREFADSDLAARVYEYADAHFEPTWDGSTGEFHWGFHLGEPYPRGQFNAAMLAAEAASEGAWYRFGQQRLPDTPLVHGVDFPTVGLTDARWDDGILHLQLSAATPAILGTRTTFDIVGLSPSTGWQASGGHDTVVTETPDRRLRIETTVDPTPITIRRPA